ncbi:MAG TPA: hypothetical protein PLX69_25005 [Leptospiraceae bacterium]|nr:hypothetical protein [Leptospiraceae bacterium]
MFGCVDELGAGFAIPFVFGYFVDEYRIGSKVDVQFVDNTRLLLGGIRGFCLGREVCHRDTESTED